MSYKRLIFYLVTIATIIIVYLKFSELRLLQEFFHQSNYGFFLAVLIIQFFAYLFQAVNYRTVLQIKGLSVGVWELFPISFVVQFISQALPTANLSGQVFFIYYLKKYGLSFAEGVGRGILEVATLYVAHAAYFVASVVLLLRRDVFERNHTLIFFVYAFGLFLLICALILFLSQKRARSSRMHWLFDRFTAYLKRSGLLNLPGLRVLAHHSDHFTLIKEQFRETLGYENLKRHKALFLIGCFWQAVFLLTHIMTLYVIAISLGHPIGFAACLVAFTFSKFLSMVSIFPGAPGVFEGAMTLILITFGVDKSVALAATLLTRAFTFWLPMPIGWILYGRYMKKFESEDYQQKLLLN